MTRSRFSRRVPENLAPNRLARLVARLREAGEPLIDLTLSNPTQAGFAYPPDLLSPLADPSALTYEPAAAGLEPARRAVAAARATPGPAIDPARVVLAASTSEAYAFVFKLLCDPGDRVLVPRPSYPLFEFLTRLEGIDADPYPLEYHGAWEIDLGALERTLSGRTRAIVIVNPNNPTGSYLKRAELDAIVALAAERNLALVSDEVFFDYPLEAPADAVSVLDQDAALAFSLGGLSKSAGLPQLKLGWLVAGGPLERVAEALARLEVIADTYLSVSTPVQRAAAALLVAGRTVRAAIQQRIRENHRALLAAVRQAPAVQVLRTEGGWSAVLRVPAIRPEEALVVELLERDRVLVHPGYFFDFAAEAYLVTSLLNPPDSFQEGVGRILARVGRP